MDLLAPFALEKRLIGIGFELHVHIVDAEFHIKLFRCSALGQIDIDGNFFKGLVPEVFIGLTTVAGVRFLL